MSGILDNKTRVLDTIITFEGRKQIAAGKLKIEHVSFTDGATFYKADLTSGSADASVRVYFEQCNLPQDQITFEADDAGKLQPFNGQAGVQVRDGQIVSYSFPATQQQLLSGSSQNLTFISGSEFASTADDLLASAIDNFKNLQIIASRDPVFEDDGFGVGNKNMEFVITNDRPISDPNHYATHINYLESLFNDVKLSKLRNFQYLPPLNRIDDDTLDKKDYRATSKYHLGKYAPWGRTHVFGLSPEQLELELGYYEKLGYSRVINFDPTSRDNRLLAQFFEVNFNTMKKLDIIDFGQYMWRGTLKRTFFIGRVMTDDNESHTFVHLFTLAFG